MKVSPLMNGARKRAGREKNCARRGQSCPGLNRPMLGRLHQHYLCLGGNQQVWCVVQLAGPYTRKEFTGQNAKATSGR